MAQNEKEVRMNVGRKYPGSNLEQASSMTLYGEGMTEQESLSALHRLRGANKRCRRVEDKRIGRWMPSIGREFYCVYCESPKEYL